jgi:hypothetical protein
MTGHVGSHTVFEGFDAPGLDSEFRNGKPGARRPRADLGRDLGSCCSGNETCGREICRFGRPPFEMGIEPSACAALLLKTGLVWQKLSNPGQA